jgi:hypothetical protein
VGDPDTTARGMGMRRAGGVAMTNLVTILFTSVRIEADCAGWP